jgi:alpha-galactosidase
LNEWGYHMVKLDFLYSVCLIPTKTKTRGQIMTEAMKFLRECVGDKLILGCGVPL